MNSDAEADPLRLFLAALPAHVRRRVTPPSYALITAIYTAAVHDIDLTTLAHDTAVGISDTNPANPAALIASRIRRDTGTTNEGDDQ